jgi:protein-tyrosine phosphatase
VEGAPVRLLFVCLGNICRSPTAEGVMRALVREAGLEDSDRARLGGHRRLARRQPARRARRRAARARGIALEGAARQVRERGFRGFRSHACDGRSNLRELRRWRRRAERAKVRLLREFDPASAWRRAISTCPTPTTARGRLRGGARSRAGGLRGPARSEIAPGGGVSLPAGARDVRRVGGGDINEAFHVVLADGREAFVKTRADAPRASTRRRPRACAGWPSRARCARRACSTSARLPGARVDRARSPGRAGAEELGRGLAATHAAGAPRFGEIRRLTSAGGPARASARWRLPTSRPPTGPRFYAERRLRRWP